MLKEMIQKMMKDPSAYVGLQSGQLQLAGISDVERRALVDVLGSTEGKIEPMKSHFWTI